MPVKISSVLLLVFALLLSISSPEEAQGHCPMEKLFDLLPYGALWYFSSSSSTTDYSSDISGTPDCRHVDLALLQKELFFVKNFQKIAEEISQGSGGYLNALATLNGCPESYFSEFNSVLQVQYAQLFGSGSSGNSLHVLKKLEKTITFHPILSQVCDSIDLR
ncbi:MAG: DUF3015 family protein [SAR324 cluster bacterium]|nr:DUF3015 family protein [SAR324 cluster bacterium]